MPRALRDSLDRSALSVVLQVLLVERRRHARPSIQHDTLTAALRRTRAQARCGTCRGRGTFCGVSAHVDGFTACDVTEHAIPCPFCSGS